MDTKQMVVVVTSQGWEKAFENHLLDENRSWRTVKAYSQDLRHFCAWFERVNAEAFRPELLTRMDISRYRAHLVDELQAAASTWNRRLAALRVFSRWCVSMGYIGIDPTEGVEPKKQEEQPPRWLERAELMKVLRICEQQINGASTIAWKRQAVRDQAMIYLMAFAGLREFEVAALNVSDLEISDRKGRVTIRSGKGDKGREIPLSSEARRALRQWLDIFTKETCVRGESLPPRQALFIGKGADRVTTRTIERRVEAIGQAAGIELSPHMLRHTFAKRMLDEGAALNVVQKLLGHARLDTTLRYVKPGWGDFERAVERI